MWVWRLAAVKGTFSHVEMLVLVIAPGVLVKMASLQVCHAYGRLSSVDGGVWTLLL